MLVEGDFRLQQQLIEILSHPADIGCLHTVSSAKEALENRPPGALVFRPVSSPFPYTNAAD